MKCKVCETKSDQIEYFEHDGKVCNCCLHQLKEMEKNNDN